jgi:small subunit ribosomal protein S4e
MIKIDGKVRRDPRFPLGIMDVVTIDKTNENFRILLDTKGRFLPHRIDHKEAGFKLCKVLKKRIGKAKVPHIVTHDGRTIRYPHPDVAINDCVKINLSTGAIDGIVKFNNNAIVMITGGNNIGRIGTLTSLEKHPGSFEIAHITDKTGHKFSTRLQNVMVIGDHKNATISLPKGEGIKLTLVEERNIRLGREADEEEEGEEDED